MASVKETIELLDGLKVIAEVGADIFEDGKLKFNDLTKLTQLADSFTVLSEAVKGLDQIDNEVKDLTIAEITEILTKVYEIVLVFKKEQPVEEVVEAVTEEPVEEVVESVTEEPVVEATTDESVSE